MGIGNCFGEVQAKTRPYDDIDSYINQIKEKEKEAASSKEKKNLTSSGFDYFSSTSGSSQMAFASSCRSLQHTIETLYLTGQFKTRSKVVMEDDSQQFFYTTSQKFRKSKRSMRFYSTRKRRRSQRSKSNDYSSFN